MTVCYGLSCGPTEGALDLPSPAVCMGGQNGAMRCFDGFLSFFKADKDRSFVPWVSHGCHQRKHKHVSFAARRRCLFLSKFDAFCELSPDHRLCSISILCAETRGGDKIPWVVSIQIFCMFTLT